MRQEQNRTSPWVWIAAGCGGCLVLTVAAMVAIGVFGYRFTRQMVEDLENPESREAKVLEILGAEELPEGYYPAMGISIPWLTDVAILSGKPVEYHRPSEDSLDIDLEEGDFGDRVFIYVSKRSFGDPQHDVERFFSGRATRAMNMNIQGIRLGARELLREGEIEVRGTPVRYRIDHGDLETEFDEGSGRTGGREVGGLLIRLHFQCPNDGRIHLGIWSGPAAEGAVAGASEQAAAERPPVERAPDEGAASGSASAVGLPTDEASLRDFLAHFDVCG
jgi:hypothetical protein